MVARIALNPKRIRGAREKPLARKPEPLVASLANVSTEEGGMAAAKKSAKAAKRGSKKAATKRAPGRVRPTDGGTTEVKQGSVVVTIPADLALPATAGKLDKAAVGRIRRARTGLGDACAKTAAALAKASGFTAPKGVDATSLAAKGARATGMDALVRDAEALLVRLKQANLLVDAEADADLRRMNDQVKAQAKDDPTLLVTFKDLIAYFKNAPKKPPPPTPPPAS